MESSRFVSGSAETRALLLAPLRPTSPTEEAARLERVQVGVQIPGWLPISMPTYANRNSGLVQNQLFPGSNPGVGTNMPQ